MLLLVLVEEGFKVLVDRVQECIDFLQTGLSERLDLTDSIVDHGSQLMPLVRILLGGQVEFVEDDLADLDDLLMRELEIFVCNRHPKVRVHQIC